MRKITFLGLFFFSLAFADTPPPGTVKAKVFSGDGVTSISATGTALDVNVVGGVTGSISVDQGSTPWVSSVTSSVLPSNAATESGGHLESIDTKLSGVTISSLPAVSISGVVGVTGDFYPAVQSVTGAVSLNSGSNTIGGVYQTTPSPLTVKQAAITIGTSADRLTSDGGAPSASRVLLGVQLDPDATAACYLGASSVTSSGAGRGILMFAGQTFVFNNDAGDYYAICDDVGQTFFITEQE